MGGGVGGGRGGLEAKAEFQANENQRQSFFFWSLKNYSSLLALFKKAMSSDKTL